MMIALRCRMRPECKPGRAAWPAAAALLLLLTFAEPTTGRAPAAAAIQNPGGTEQQVIFREDFETNTDAWQREGQWRLQAQPEKLRVLSPQIVPALVQLPGDGLLPAAAQGGGVAWFGEPETGTYIGKDFFLLPQPPAGRGISPVKPAGWLLSPIIDLSRYDGQPLSLVFSTWWEIEGRDPAGKDLLVVEAAGGRSAAGTGAAGFSPLGRGALNPRLLAPYDPVQSYSSGGPGMPGIWQLQLYDLSRFAGDRVQIRFRFDAIDTLHNAFRGWMIDDLRLVAGRAAPPEITSVQPKFALAGDVVRIEGANFVHGARVFLGEASVEAEGRDSASVVFRVAPLWPAIYSVSLINPDGQSASIAAALRLTVRRAPAIREAAPSWTWQRVPATLHIRGQNFAAGAQVALGQILLQPENILGDTLIIAQTPADLEPGDYDLTITNLDTQSGVLRAGFRVRANQPPVISPPSLRRLAVAGQRLTIDAGIFDDHGLVETLLYFRGGGERSFASQPLVPTAAGYAATLPAGAVTSRGLEYFLTATDSAGAQTREPQAGSYSLPVLVPEPGVRKAESQPGGSSQNAYRLISSPLRLLDPSPEAFLADDLGPPAKNAWRLFELDSRGLYIELPDIQAIIPGKGYWLIVREGGKFIDTGRGLAGEILDVVDIPLRPGWNLIANPYNFAISGEKLALVNASGELVAGVRLRAYDGRWNDPLVQPVTAIEPFAGYAVFNGSGAAALRLYPKNSSQGIAPPLNVRLAPDDLARAVQLSLRSGDAVDADNYAIIAPAPERLAIPEPPVIGKYVSAYFEPAAAGEASGALCVEARRAVGEGQVWNLRLASNRDEAAVLTAERIAGISSEFEVLLIDSLAGLVQDLRRQPAYELPASRMHEPVQLQLAVGSEPFVERLAGPPRLFALYQNFPNPFNPVTAIQFDLPENAAVSLKIYDLLGRHVASLVRDEAFVAGRHTVLWDGRDTQGREAASGVYLYRLQAGRFQDMRKLTLLR